MLCHATTGPRCGQTLSRAAGFRREPHAQVAAIRHRLSAYSAGYRPDADDAHLRVTCSCRKNIESSKSQFHVQWVHGQKAEQAAPTEVINSSVLFPTLLTLSIDCVLIRCPSSAPPSRHLAI